MLPVEARTVVRLERDELAHGGDARQPQHVEAAGRGLACAVERGSAAIITSANRSMYDQ